MKKANTAIYSIKNQEQALQELEEKGIIENFRYIDLIQTLKEFYNLQGMCERIKNTPFPRQYAFFSSVFVRIFVFLLPLEFLLTSMYT